MANFPIEIMVKLTYTIIKGGDLMAEFCFECFNKISGNKQKKWTYIISKDLDWCDVCGEWKHVVVSKRWAYYAHKFKFLVYPIIIVVSIAILPYRLVMLPYVIYQSKKHNKKAY